MVSGDFSAAGLGGGEVFKAFAAGNGPTAAQLEKICSEGTQLESTIENGGDVKSGYNTFKSDCESAGITLPDSLTDCFTNNSDNYKSLGIALKSFMMGLGYHSRKSSLQMI